MRQKHCALAALYVCALLGWNQLCATLSQTSDLVAKPPTAAQPDAFFAEGTTPHLCLNAEHLRHARPACGREAAPVRWAAWAAAAAGRRRARAPASALRSVRHPKLHTSPEKNTVCHITLITQVESNIGEICLCVSTRTSFSNMLLIEREKKTGRDPGSSAACIQGGAPL